MDKIILDREFPSFVPELTKAMEITSEHLAESLDFKHLCGAICSHQPSLHVRVNDTRTGKGIDRFFTLQ